MSKKSLEQLEREARALCRHSICYTDLQSKTVAKLALRGITTKAIAEKTGMSEGKAQYRIAKAQNELDTKFRSNYRNGQGKLAEAILAATDRIAERFVNKEIAPRFIPFARRGVGRLAQ